MERVTNCQSNNYDMTQRSSFCFDLLVGAMDYLSIESRPKQRLVSRHWRVAYWGRCEKLTVKDASRFVELIPILYCTRELRFVGYIVRTASPWKLSNAVKLDLRKVDCIECGALEELLHIEGVVSIDIAASNVEHGERLLKECKGANLQSLNVSSTKGITDASMREVAAHCPNLQSLNVSGTKSARALQSAPPTHRCMKSQHTAPTCSPLM